MKVFTKEWISEIRVCYEELPRHERPDIYFIATNDTPICMQMRAEIERGLSILPLPPEKLAICISRLRDNRYVYDTYHEIVCGLWLRRLGYEELEYETEYGTKTPDWTVTTQGKVLFVVEVFTKDPPQSNSLEARDLWERFWDCLREIELDYYLQIAVDPSYLDPFTGLDTRKPEEMVQRIKEWLTEATPSVGERIVIEGVSLMVLQKDNGRKHLGYCGPLRIFVPDSGPEQLRNKIQKKVKKYNSLARSGIPLVIAVFHNPRTFLDDLDFADALVDMEDSAFRSLSTAVWIWRDFGSGGEWRFKPVLNPNADNQLPPETFAEKVR